MNTLYSSSHLKAAAAAAAAAAKIELTVAATYVSLSGNPTDQFF